MLWGFFGFSFAKLPGAKGVHAHSQLLLSGARGENADEGPSLLPPPLAPPSTVRALVCTWAPAHPQPSQPLQPRPHLQTVALSLPSHLSVQRLSGVVHLPKDRTARALVDSGPLRWGILTSWAPEHNLEGVRVEFRLQAALDSLPCGKGYRWEGRTEQCPLVIRARAGVLAARV